jgi:hypothetical protein
MNAQFLMERTEAKKGDVQIPESTLIRENTEDQLASEESKHEETKELSHEMEVLQQRCPNKSEKEIKKQKFIMGY